MALPYLASIVFIAALVSGCSDAGWYPGRVETPTSLSLRPTAQETETLDRIADRPQPLPVVFAERGDLWPGAPPQVQTLADLRREHHYVMGPKPHRGGYGLCNAGTHAGVALGLC